MKVAQEEREMRGCGRRETRDERPGRKEEQASKNGRATAPMELKGYKSREHEQIEGAMLPHDSNTSMLEWAAYAPTHLREDNKVPDLQR